MSASPLTAPWRVLVLPPIDATLAAALLDGLPATVTAPAERTQAAAVAAARDAEVVVGDWSGQLRVDADLIASAPSLAAVLQPSVGVDSLDVDALAAARVPAANAAGANTDAVAEWCLAAALACLRLLVVADGEVRAGDWPQLTLAARGARELDGTRVGIVGFGAIGQAAARLFRALGCDVAQWSRRRRDEEPWLELDELLTRSDVLVVVVALAEQTRGLLGRDRLASLPPGAVLVNAARGGIVDEAAAAELVRAGRLTAAAFDVFAVEPLPADSPLRGDPRILLSPHAAGSSRQAQGRILGSLRANAERLVAGAALADVVNGVDPVVRRR